MILTSFTPHNSSEHVQLCTVLLQQYPPKFLCLKLITLKCLVTTTCQLLSLDENVTTSFKTFHFSEKCWHFVKSKLPCLLQFRLFFTFLLRVFQKFSNPNGCCTLKTHSCVCDSFVSSLIQLLMNNQTTTFQQFHQLPYHCLSYTLVMTHQHTQHLVFSIFFKYNQQDSALYNILYYCQCSACFRRFLRPSSGAQKLYTQHLVYVNLACCYRQR